VKIEKNDENSATLREKRKLGIYFKSFIFAVFFFE